MARSANTSASTALTIGNFDGVHRGHVALIEAARREVGPGGRVIVLSFDPHPASVLRPDRITPPLTRFERRAELLRDAGADDVEVLTPTRELLSTEPAEFLREMVRRFEPAVIVEGPDFRFGRRRAGDVGTLREHEAEHGYRTLIIEPIEFDLIDQTIVRVSSSMIRRLIGHGRVGDAARLLGRPYALDGSVVQGDRRGRELGVPTANLDHGALLLPADGIYAGWSELPDGSRAPSAISVGDKPTFAGAQRICEVHLIDHDAELDDYGWPLRVEFHHWLRDQLRYDDVEALRAQIERDIAAARKRLGVETAAVR